MLLFLPLDSPAVGYIHFPQGVDGCVLIQTPPPINLFYTRCMYTFQHPRHAIELNSEVCGLAKLTGM